jgi:hypothetical protein
VKVILFIATFISIMACWWYAGVDFSHKGGMQILSVASSFFASFAVAFFWDYLG